MSEEDKSVLLESLTEEEVISVTKIIISRSDSFCRRFPFLVIDDCIQASWRELMQYQTYFDPAKGKITSWVYKLVSDTLTSYAQKEYNKTQKWDNIEDLEFADVKISRPDKECAYVDLLETLEQVLTPWCFAYLQILEKDPGVCIASLSEQLSLSERDLGYLREELRTTTKHILGGVDE